MSRNLWGIFLLASILLLLSSWLSRMCFYVYYAGSNLQQTISTVKHSLLFEHFRGVIIRNFVIEILLLNYMCTVKN